MLKAQATRQDRAARFRELMDALRSELSVFSAAFQALSAATDQFVVVQCASGGGISLSHLVAFGVLATAGVPAHHVGLLPGLSNSTSGSTGFVDMFVALNRDGVPAITFASFIYVREEDTWFLRVPILSVGGELRLMPVLAKRFCRIDGPFRLRLDSTERRARAFGRELGESSVLLLSEYMDHLTAGRAVDDPRSWQQPETKSD